MADEKNIKVPDIGGAEQVDVIEILVNVGDEISEETPLITLESDKASMEIPAPQAGIVRSIALKTGDKVSQGDVILSLEPVEDRPKNSEEASKAPESPEASKPSKEDTKSEQEQEASPPEPPKAPDINEREDVAVFAGPAVRRLAREFGVDLNEVRGSGRKSRITKEDVQTFVKLKLQEQPVSSGPAVASAPDIDFSRFGEVEIKPLNKIKRLTGSNVHRAWVTIPHVTQFDEADITALETFRRSELEEAAQSGYKLTMLAFVCKVVCKALAVFPQFNSSLDNNGEQLIYKRYFNIGVAVDTPHGLVVPVLKEVDQLSVADIAMEMTRLSTKARDKGLMPAEMSGGCFTISSLGGIGGTAFTPIVNAPEVAILGVSRSSKKPVYMDGTFQPRLMLPLSLSYDHRVIDGAEAARFTRFIAEHLSDIRKLLL